MHGVSRKHRRDFGPDFACSAVFDLFLQVTTMLVGEGAKLDVHGCKTVDMASSFGKVSMQPVPNRGP